MPYTTDNNFPLIAAGSVEWYSLYNDLAAKVEAGRTLYLEAGENLVIRDPFYIGTDGKAYKANSNTDCDGIWQSTSTNLGASGFGQKSGTMTYASWIWNEGVLLYVNSSGALSETPTPYCIGKALSATKILITPRGYIGDIKNLSSLIQAAITATSTVNMGFALPTGVKIIATLFKVNNTLTEKWDASYSTGSTYSICLNQATSQNTKFKGFVDLGGRITTDITDITITKNGGGAFSSKGTITAKVIYQQLEDFI